MNNLDTLASPEPELQTLEAQIESEIGVLGAGNVVAFGLARGQLVVAVSVAAELRALLQPDAVAKAVVEVAAQRGESARFVVLVEDGELPRTAAGALDRDAVRALWRAERLRGFATYDSGRRQAAPEAPGAFSEIERARADIWGEVLGTSAIDPSASFFALGGSSVDVARVLTRIEERFGRALDLEAFFESPTLAGAARVLARGEATPQVLGFAPIAAAPRAARLPLSSAQRRMRFAWQLDPQGAAYNICGALELSGELDVGALGRALDALEARHESLRTRFPEDAAGAWQQIEPARGVALLVSDLGGQPAEQRGQSVRGELATEASAPFDLEHGPLWRARLVRLGREEHVLCVCLHHIIADGASMDVLVRELCELYAADREGRAPELGALPIQYADYAGWQAERLAAGEEARQLGYWMRELEGELAPPPDGTPSRAFWQRFASGCGRWRASAMPASSWSCS